ncbi:hypothetical protein J437_LFUL007223 [Ladona fulva]|uniref:Centromere protein I n=1 Tax=Ladona fulva TaxID=123851 RepID=A0A8K0K514_LADFU|nr:hypothetical protein J437_LFUL007223 [Ladona fulva]
MSDFRDAILFLKSIKKEYVFSKDELFTVCRFIYPQAYRNGLSDEEMKIISEVLKVDTLPTVEYQELMKCLIPKTYVPDQVVIDVAISILSYIPDQPTVKVLCAVQWLIGVIGLGLTKTKKLDCMYSLFFDLLLKTNIDLQLCPLIQLMTKSHLISRKHIHIVNYIRKYKGKKKVHDSLLSIFKRMDPDLVPEGLPPPLPTQSLVSGLAESWKGLHMAKSRIAEQFGMRMNSTVVQSSHWDKASISIIPQISYLSPKESRKRTLHDVASWEDLGTNMSYLNPPCQSMSLLRSHFGMFFLAFGSHCLQKRFSSSLHEILLAVFVRKQHNIFIKPEMREAGEKHLLQQVAVFQEFLGQPIPVVSAFLAKYLQMWSGDEHRVLLLRLLCYVHFSTFDELKSVIITPLSMLFISGDLEFKCAIINMFKEFMKNLMLKEKCREGKKSPFLNLTRTWDPADVYPKLFEEISYLISIGLSAEIGKSLFISTCLAYYHMMLSILCSLNCEYMLVPPPTLMYHSLFSHSLQCLSQACMLLIR